LAIVKRWQAAEGVDELFVAPDVEQLLQSFVALEAAASRFAQFYLKVGREPVENHVGR
jgi:hypothetical protein